MGFNPVFEKRWFICCTIIKKSHYLWLQRACCSSTGSFTSVVMGFSELNIEYNHRTLWQLTSAQHKGNKERPRSYWLRQQSRMCLLLTPLVVITQDRNHFWSTQSQSVRELQHVSAGQTTVLKKSVWNLVSDHDTESLKGQRIKEFILKETRLCSPSG